MFRALHKTPAVRFQSARDLARALRQLQGRTLPLDLRTEPVFAPGIHAPSMPAPRRWWRRRNALAAAVAAALVLVGAPLWVLAPVERAQIVVAPVVNQTGYAELDAYRLALTQELTAQLEESAVVRPLPYGQLLQMVRRFRDTGRDISSRDAFQVIRTSMPAAIVLSPTVVYENNNWIARVQVIPGGASTPSEQIDTAPVTSSLAKEAVYGLIAQLAARVNERFTATGPRRAYFGGVLRAGMGSTPAAGNRLRSLDAAAAFADGTDTYEQQEHSVALRAFTTASELDSTNALPQAWRSRTARLMGQSRIAEEAAATARRLEAGRLQASDRLFVEAVVAESQRDAITAEARYRELTEQWADDAAWQLELGAFLDRQGQGRYRDAETAYTAALALDPSLTRAHLELCRLYGPARLNDPPNARTHGEEALTAYRRLGAVAGEAQARWCLADVLNIGDTASRTQAMTHAGLARDALVRLEYGFNLSRAYNYLALAAGSQGRFPEAAWLVTR